MSFPELRKMSTVLGLRRMPDPFYLEDFSGEVGSAMNVSMVRLGLLWMSVSGWVSAGGC